MDQWKDTLNTAVNNIGSFIQVCQNIFDENEMNELDQTFGDIVKGFCMVDIEHQATIESLNKTKQYYEDKNNDMDVPVEKCYEKFYEKRMNKNLNKQIEKHSLWARYRSNFEEIEEEDNRETVDEDSGLVSMDVFVPPTDPISKTLIRNPVRNNKCGHIYEKDTILVLIKKNTRCPYIGCPNKQHITPANLIEDDKLKRQIERHLLKKK